MDPTQARELLLTHGPCKSQPASDWTGDIPLPAAVSDFYRDVGPLDFDFDLGGSPLCMRSLHQLWDYQAGYRWNGNTGERLTDWADAWLVVADIGADPFIFDSGSSRILFARHGAGAWQPEDLLPSISVMAASFGILASIRMSAGDDFMDDDFEISSRYCNQAMQELDEKVGLDDRGELLLTTIEWL